MHLCRAPSASLRQHCALCRRAGKPHGFCRQGAPCLRGGCTCGRCQLRGGCERPGQLRPTANRCQQPCSRSNVSCRQVCSTRWRSKRGACWCLGDADLVISHASRLYMHACFLRRKPPHQWWYQYWSWPSLRPHPRDSPRWAWTRRLISMCDMCGRTSRTCHPSTPHRSWCRPGLSNPALSAAHPCAQSALPTPAGRRGAQRSRTFGGHAHGDHKCQAHDGREGDQQERELPAAIEGDSHASEEGG